VSVKRRQTETDEDDRSPKQRRGDDLGVDGRHEADQTTEAQSVGKGESDEHQHPFAYVGLRVRRHVQAHHQSQSDEDHQVTPEKGVEETNVGARRGGDHGNGQGRIHLFQMNLNPFLEMRKVGERLEIEGTISHQIFHLEMMSVLLIFVVFLKFIRYKP